MPSETFFRLPESKQQRIIEAIKEEIARVPYENFSIGNVIRQCSISRGSFYQYFRNKEDIYLYLISTYQQQIFQHLQDTLQKQNGDFFSSLEITFRFAVRMLCYKDSKAFRHNLFCNIRLYEILWQKEGYAEENLQSFQQFQKYINTDNLNVANDDELSVLFDICLLNALKDAAGIFMAEDNEQTALDHFLVKHALLKKAYQKE